MIKFLGMNKDKPVFGFGLSEGNIEKLVEGKPIMVDLSTMGPYEGQVLIFYGVDEQVMYTMLRQEGLVGPKTQINPQTELHEGSGQ